MREYREFTLNGLEIVDAPEWVPKDHLNKISEAKAASTAIPPQYIDSFMNFAIDRLWEVRIEKRL